MAVRLRPLRLRLGIVGRGAGGSQAGEGPGTGPRAGREKLEHGGESRGAETEAEVRPRARSRKRRRKREDGHDRVAATGLHRRGAGGGRAGRRESARGSSPSSASGRDDGEGDAERLVERVLGYRVFPDGHGRMNLSLAEYRRGAARGAPVHAARGHPQGGRGPGSAPGPIPTPREVSSSASSRSRRARHPVVETGRFGERMQVRLCNEGPVTFWLETRGAGRRGLILRRRRRIAVRPSRGRRGERAPSAGSLRGGSAAAPGHPVACLMNFSGADLAPLGAEPILDRDQVGRGCRS